MILFNTSCVDQLASRLPFYKGKITRKYFSDGELYIKIEESVAGKKIVVLAATPAPADNILELALLLDALYRAKAHINLILTYGGYTRQQEAAQGEAHATSLISSLVTRISFEKAFIIHAHNARLQHYVSFTDVIPYSFFEPLVLQADAIVAPDKGAQQLAFLLAQKCKLPLILVEKKRPTHEKVEIIAIEGDVAEKRVLIVDDMITTGSTIAVVAHALHARNAKNIIAAATHGIFAGNALENIKDSPISHIYVTNSVNSLLQSEMITRIDLLPEIEQVIKSL